MRERVKTVWIGSVLGVALSLGVIFALALADGSGGSVSTTLSNGAALEVAITSPLTSTEFKVPPGVTDIDVNVQGTASVGEGDPDATFVYVIDVSGSTGASSGACGTIIQCEQTFFVNLNNQANASGEVDLVGVAVFGAGGANADMAAAGGDQKLTSVVTDANTVINSTNSGGGVGQFTAKNVGAGSTNYEAAVNAAATIVTDLANNNGTTRVIMASDGLSNTGTLANAIAGFPVGVAIDTIAIAGAVCGAGLPVAGTGTLEQIAQATGGTCFPVPDPNNLPSLIPTLIGSTLDSLEIDVDAGGFVTIPNSQISLPLPQPGAVTVTYGTDILNPTTVMNLGPGDHMISVKATGSDVLGDTQSVTDTHTIHLLQLTASPATESNDLNVDDQHTVTAAIVGGSGPDRNIDFVVSGQNAGTANPGNQSINATPGGAAVDFVYTVPQDCASLGTDTITVSTTIAGVLCSIDVTKEWTDPVPPNVSCDPTVNPRGKREPQAPGTGQNEDGFYQLNAEDPNLANCTVTLQVVDGSGYVFPGPFLPGDRIKYTQDDSTPQEQKKMGSANGNAGAVKYHLIGHGDLTVTGTDPSGNQSSAVCLVPQPPK